MRALLLLIIVTLAACKDPAPAPPAPAPVPSPSPAVAVKRTPIDEAAAAGTIEAWDRAATQLDATFAACTTPTAECLEAGRDAVAAHGRAQKLEHLTDPRSPNVPVALPARTVALVAACDAYAKRAEPSDPELPRIEMIAAHEQYAHGWLDATVTRTEEILREHRDSEAAALAVPPLLDALRRMGRAAQLKGWVDSLLADTRFLAGKAELRELLEGLHAL